MNDEENRIDETYKKGKITFSEAARKQYEKSYGVVGNHSGIQICHWTKNSLRGGPGCYKVKFYGIDCHRCAQMSPALAWCNEACIFCWRPMEWMKKTRFVESEVDDPQEIIDGCVKERKRIVSGFGGFGPHEARFRESLNRFPSHWAISLSGEPTIYPKLADMVRLLRVHPEVKTIFIVTNGQEYDHLEKLAKEKSLPTQLYLSLAAYDEESFTKINRSVYSDGWKRLLKTIELFPKLDCRKAIRLTLINTVNDSDDALSGFAELIECSKTDFVEVKSYMALGFSRKRLGPNNMLEHYEMVPIVEKLLEFLPNYKLVSEDESSRIMLLKRNDCKHSNLIKK